jgi:cytochrome P450
MAYDLSTLTLDVLAHAAFGKSFDFHGGKNKTSSSYNPSYRDALGIILENAILILAFGPRMLSRLAFVPGLGHVSRAITAFEQYMEAMFEEKAQESNARGNLISSLVRASIEDKLLTPEEVIGNIFVFNFAGHDTTAHSLAFTFMLLAAHPEVQEWMSEEIDYVLGDVRTAEPGYESYPRLVRTLAVMVRYAALNPRGPEISLPDPVAGKSKTV